MSGAPMSDEGFFRRWARLKSTGGDAAPVEPPRPPAAPAPAPVPVTARREAKAGPLPTLEDVARLTPDADFSAFVAQGVDKSVQRLALKKLFSDPHFNMIDGLDMYMSDYNQASPLSPAMLASLKHAPGVLSRLFGDEQESEQQIEDTSERAPEQEGAPLSTQGKA